MKRYLKYAAYGFAGLLGIIVVVVAASALWLTQSLPRLDGSITVAGPKAAITITRDKDGVPHIFAQSRDDALFGLGFVHAQDRLWQLDFQRRAMQGRLSELAGSSTLVADVYLRSVGIYRAAQAALHNLSPDTRAAIDAYTAGINAGRAQGGGVLPPEFFMLGVNFEPWTATDSVAVLKGLAVQLSANAFREIFRLQLLKQLGPERLATFEPPMPPEVVEAYRRYAPADSIKLSDALDAMDAIAPMMERVGASNNWVVGGNRTVSGKPLVANDPHLPLSLPAVWYLAHLSWPGYDAIGGSIPGIPSIIAGRTRHTAWGMTTTGADVQDLYWERIDPKDPEKYQAPDGPRAFDVREETIKVRFGSDVTVKVRATRHGPVLPTDEPRLKALVPEGFALSLAWPALSADDRTIETAIGILSADHTPPEEVKRVFDIYRAPIQSFVYGSDEGDVGLILPGSIPVRGPGNLVKGLLPGDGRDPVYDWQGFIPYEEGPHWSAREDGVFVSANNNVVPQGYAPQIALDFDVEYRARRISELLAARPKHDVESFRAIQMDRRDLFAAEMVPLMVAQTQGSDDRAKSALAMLAKWDGEMDAARAEPLIYSAWFRALTKAVYADELGENFERVWNFRTEFMTTLLHGDAKATKWCDDTTTADTVETCANLLARSLDTSLDELSGAYGSNMSEWRWGAAHRANFSHTPFGFIPVLRDVFNRRVEVGGGAFTVERADYRFNGREPYAAVHGSGYRGIYDLADPNASLYMASTGASGNIYSPYYDNLIERWSRGEYLRMTTERAAIEDGAVGTLTLQPSSADSAR